MHRQKTRVIPAQLRDSPAPMATQPGCRDLKRTVHSKAQVQSHFLAYIQSVQLVLRELARGR